MPTPKLFTRQYRDNDGKTYLVFRYWDNHLNNYEYQVYKLVTAKDVARKLLAKKNNLTVPKGANTRQMWDFAWEYVDPIKGVYQEENE